jgi:hypothetical protein
MATDKKHIAVYLDPAVEQALIAFCEQKGLKSKKGFMYSAGVNAALVAFFGIADIDNILQSNSNTPAKSSNIPSNQPSTVPKTTGNILGKTPPEALQEVLPGKSETGDSVELPKVDSEVVERLQNELGNLKAENETLKTDYAQLLESSTVVTKKLDQEVQELRSQLEIVQAENETLRSASPAAQFELPEAPELLNRLKAKRKKVTASLADIETILEILQS